MGFREGMEYAKRNLNTNDNNSNTDDNVYLDPEDYQYQQEQDYRGKVAAGIGGATFLGGTLSRNMDNHNIR